MAIAHDADTDGGLVNPGTSLTWAHPCTGSDLALFVGLFGDDTSDTITGVTYNTVAMTQIGVIQVLTDRFVYLYGLLNPASGTHDVVASSSASIVIAGSSSSYTGVGTLIDSSSTASDGGGDNLFTQATTVVATSCWIHWAFKNTTGGAVTPSSGPVATQRLSHSGLYTWDSNGTVSTGPQSSTVDMGVNVPAAGVMVSFAPAVAAGGYLLVAN